MKRMKTNEVRENFLSFFEKKKDHLRMKSFSLVPKNDKSVLLINAGMTPLKPYFTGEEKPPKDRVVTCQKCIRTGDIENVGKTARHGTFFEMLGNFSFGDYFKEEIIPWSWEYVTKELKMPVEKLWVTIYKDDDESYEIWKNKVGLPDERILRFGKEDNFWEHGNGPCGPCSEIFYDRGEDPNCDNPDCKMGCECDRYIEFWNLVFTQYNKTDDGYIELKNKNIDTGMGLERVAMIMQDVESIFDIDTIKEVRDKVCEVADVKYKENKEKDISIRIITDHIRSMTFMISDGILVSNEGRGYVLRRIIRRALRHGKKLGLEGNFLTKIVEVVIENSKHEYTELEEKKEYIFKAIKAEEDRFNETIDQGMEILKEYIEELGKDNILDGKKAFKLYDTYGFPFELTKEILAEKGIKVEKEKFEEEMKKQRERARNARKEDNYMGKKKNVFNDLPLNYKTEFIGYNTLESESKIKNITDNQKIKDEIKKNGYLFFAETPFYAESGGQAGDKGIIITKSGKAKVENCKKVIGNKFAHEVKVLEGILKEGQTAKLVVDKANRKKIRANHSATHLLQSALRKVLGEHVEQSGSHVNDKRLRFDFTHFSPLTKEEVKSVEDLVNEMIRKNLKSNIEEMSIEKAKEMGATALFGEKYGKKVRVVKFEDESIELCGGTHVDLTSEIGLFKIISETGVSSGVRRIEGYTNYEAINYYEKIEESINQIKKKLNTNDLESRIDNLLEENKNLKSELESYKDKLIANSTDDIFEKAKVIDDFKIITHRDDKMGMNELRKLGDKLKQKLDKGILVLASGKDEKVVMVVMVTKNLVEEGLKAGNIISEALKIVNGNGGGRPDIAQGGGSDVSKINDSLNNIVEIVKEML